ncbi:MAG: caspase family protein, partial [Alphaproteobacteria bacterium]
DATVTTKSSRGHPMTIEFAADGTLPSTIKTPRRMLRDTGRWWVNDKGRLCFQWTRFGQARKRCVLLKQTGNSIELYKQNGERGKSTWAIARRGTNGRNVTTARRAPTALPTPAAPADKTGPEINLPSSLTTKDATVALAGLVKDASQIVEVTVNRRAVSVSPDGAFSIRRGVPQGSSVITVEAMDEWGNRTRRTVSVTRKVPPLQQAKLRGTEPKPARKVANPFAGIHFGQYHALVIGNNDYRTVQDLRTAEGDARAVADLLKRDYGFKVTLLTNATRADVIGGLAKMRATLKPDDSLLVYYAGHGVLDDLAEQGYWLPVDAEEGNPTNWISTSDITTMLRVIRAKHILVVADSCYSGTLVRAVSGRIKTAGAQQEWVRRMAAKRARTALVSGGLEPVADGSSKHSVFAKAFLDALSSNQSVMAGAALYAAIKRPVVLNADQTPQYSDIRRAGHDGGDFLFVRKNP